MNGTFLAMLLAAVGGPAPKNVAGCEAEGPDKVVSSPGGALTQRKLNCTDKKAGTAEVYLTTAGKTVKEVYVQARDELAQAALGVAAKDLVVASQNGAKTELAYVRHNANDSLLALTASDGDFSWRLSAGRTDEERVKATIAKQVGATVTKELAFPLPSVGAQRLLIQTFGLAVSGHAAGPGWSIVHLFDAKGAAKGRAMHVFPGAWGEVVGTLDAFPVAGGAHVLRHSSGFTNQGSTEGRVFFFEILPKARTVREMRLAGAFFESERKSISYEPTWKGKALVLVKTKDGKKTDVGPCTYDAKARDYECPKIPEDLWEQ